MPARDHRQPRRGGAAEGTLLVGQCRRRVWRKFAKREGDHVDDSDDSGGSGGSGGSGDADDFTDLAVWARTTRGLVHGVGFTAYGPGACCTRACDLARRSTDRTSVSPGDWVRTCASIVGEPTGRPGAPSAVRPGASAARVYDRFVPGRRWRWRRRRRWRRRWAGMRNRFGGVSLAPRIEQWRSHHPSVLAPYLPVVNREFAIAIFLGRHAFGGATDENHDRFAHVRNDLVNGADAEAHLVEIPLEHASDEVANQLLVPGLRLGIFGYTCIRRRWRNRRSRMCAVEDVVASVPCRAGRAGYARR